jgi:uncharacterized protein involved in exopolysaccharide biosynthesis
MMFGRRVTQPNSVPVEDQASWEAPTFPAAKADRDSPELLKGSLTISGAISFLRENGRRILTLAFALFAIGMVVLWVIPVRFAATALVVVDPREQRVTADQDVLPGIGQDVAALQSLIEIAKSDGFLRPLLEQLKVRDDEDIARGETDTSRLLEKFRNRLDISRKGLTYVIAISFTSNRPERAAYYANAVAEAFVANQSQVRTAATDEAADWLNSRLKTLNDRLRASEEAVATFKLEHKLVNIVNSGRDGTTKQLRVTELTQQVSAARLRTEEAKARYQQAQRDLKSNVDGPVKQDLLSVLRAQRSALNDQIAQRRAVFGDRHPDLVISYSQLNDLNKQIEAERKRNIETAKSEYEAQLEQQKALEIQLKAVEAEMLVDGQALVRLQELQRDADANKNIYEQFLSRFKTTNEQRLLQSSQTKIASVAVPPIRSTRPPLALLLAATAIAALLISTAAVAALDGKKNSAEPKLEIRRASSPSLQPEPPPDLPVWCQIPHLLPPEITRTIWQKPVAATAELDLSAYLRALLEKIAELPGHCGKVALVIPVENGSGSSTVARSLNMSAVNEGMLSVLIQVQSDLARAKTASAERQVAGISKASLRSVSVLLGEGQNVSPAAADDIRSEFDLIVVDAPSVTAQPDVAAVAAHADLVILVVRDGTADPAAIHEATAALSKFSAAPTGIVVNHAPARSTSPELQNEALGLAS